MKIHGFCERLLRFDVVEFDAAVPRPSAARGEEESRGAADHAADGVIDRLNSIVLWDREARRKGCASWTSSLGEWLEEVLSLGAPIVKNPSASATEKRPGMPDRHDVIDSNFKI